MLTCKKRRMLIAMKWCAFVGIATTLFLFLVVDNSIDKVDEDDTHLAIQKRNVLEFKAENRQNEEVYHVIRENQESEYQVSNTRITGQATKSNNQRETDGIVQKVRFEDNFLRITKLNVSSDLEWRVSGSIHTIEANIHRNTLKYLRKQFQYEDVPFIEYALNATLSQKLPIESVNPESRLTKCLEASYDLTSLPQVSIIIPFHDEQYSLLLRTLHSIISHTPQDLIAEIILIDDFNTLPNLRAPLEKYLRLLPKVHMYRTKTWQGLIRARLLGAMLAKADVVVFLDAHIECQAQWLEPLLTELLKDPTSLVVPAIDNIDPHTMEYEIDSHLLRGDSRSISGTFTWRLNYAWTIDPFMAEGKSPLEARPTAIVVGCAMAAKRDYFFHMGGFDEDTWVWGGENTEIAFRFWMCGGSVKILPCSKIGHMFRANLPYTRTIKYQTTHKNLQRVAEVWMDEYKELFYANKGQKLPFSVAEQASLEVRKRLKDTLKCNNFKWYLKHVANTVPVPQFIGTLYFGQLMLEGKGCITLLEHELGFYDSSYNLPSQIFHLTKTGHLKSNNGSCVQYDLSQLRCTIGPCQHNYFPQLWLFQQSNSTGSNKKWGLIKLAVANYTHCLSAAIDNSSPGHDPHYYLTLKPCYYVTADMVWFFTYKLSKPWSYL